MPLVRKPGDSPAPATPDEQLVLQALTSPASEERWKAARAAADLKGGDVALAQALRTETDVRVREAMLTGLAHIGSPVAVEHIEPALARGLDLGPDSKVYRDGA